MRTSLCVIAALGSLGAAALAAGAGCGSLPDDCLLLLTCPTGGAGGGSGEPTPVACIPNKNPGKAVDDACGIFVTSGPKGADRATGSKANPLKTLAAAVEKAKLEGRRPIYACAETFSEPLSSDAEIELYGGLDCDADWSYIGDLKKTTLTADADRIPLTLAKDSKVADFAIVAKDAMGAGQSSIAVVADQAKVSFARCEITAGNGAPGLLGTTPDTPVGPVDQTDPAIVGDNGPKACTTPGGAQKQSTYCMGLTIGGNGGAGNLLQGENGGLQPAGNNFTARGGLGQLASDSTLDCSVDANGGGGRGSNGGNGKPGPDGDGAKDDALGTLDATGFKGAAGKDGGAGQPGIGGGGGGGAKGKTPSCFGASGGGGGVGGCGGQGGKGGGSGGSSIGIIGLTARLTFDTVSIHVGDGGKGGDGGDGQPGGLGGRGGVGGVGSAGTANACTGGDGGTGGNGGKGGGGRGGHSIGIAYTSATDQEMPGAQIATGMAGLGGKGVDQSKSAVAGLAADRQRF